MSDASTQAPTTAPSSATPAGAPGADQPVSSLVDTLFDLGFGWAATGLKLGKAALEQSAKTLGHTAKALETLANELEKKEGASATKP